MKFAETAGKESRKHEGYETTCRSYGCKALLGGGNRLSNAPGTDVMSQGMRLECKRNARMLRTEKCPIQETFLERIPNGSQCSDGVVETTTNLLFPSGMADHALRLGSYM